LPGEKDEGQIIVSLGGGARLLIAGIALVRSDCLAHGFIVEEYATVEVEVFHASRFAIGGHQQ
jgi:hypothetical protein